MEVILTQALKKVGKIGDVVNVKNGFARNYLIPNNIALRASKDNIAYFETVKEEIIKKNGQAVEKAQSLASKIEGKFFTVIEQAGEDGRLYGSVNAASIASAITDSGSEIDSKSVSLQNPIKYIGSYDVEINPHAEVSTKIVVIVAKNADEAKELEEAYGNEGAKEQKAEKAEAETEEEIETTEETTEEE